MKTVILDNYDSFTYNLFQMVAELQNGREPLVFRNDAVTVKELRTLNPGHIIISPGPGNPVNHSSVGVCRDVILQMGEETPILGVCLGHLAMIEALGGVIAPSPEPRHGKTSAIYHQGGGVFKNLPNPFQAMRYHSLIGIDEGLPRDLDVTARTSDGLIMGLMHKSFPMQGVQFHPESIGTPHGLQLLTAFFEI
jgi:anthranilate synthase component II